MKEAPKSPGLRKRTQARVLALQALCAFESSGSEFSEQLSEFLHDGPALADAGIDLPPALETIQFARELAVGTREQRPEIDRRLERTSTHWTLTRMTPVDRNTLRLGVYELLDQPETPTQVVVNEALELARRFGDANSSAFVNGVLDAIRREIVAEIGPVGETPDGESGAEADSEHGAV